MLQVPAVVLATAPERPSGRLSSTVTVRAVDGPALATVRVKVSGAPGTAGSGDTVLTMESPAKSGATVAATVIVTAAPTARSPSEQVPPVQEPTPAVAVSPVTPAGAGS